MLKHAFGILEREHPDLIQSRETKSRLKLKQFKIQKNGRNTVLTNFEETCQSYVDELYHFFFSVFIVFNFLFFVLNLVSSSFLLKC